MSEAFFTYSTYFLKASRKREFKVLTDPFYFYKGFFPFSFLKEVPGGGSGAEGGPVCVTL